MLSAGTLNSNRVGLRYQAHKKQHKHVPTFDSSVIRTPETVNGWRVFYPGPYQTCRVESRVTSHCKHINLETANVLE